MSSRTLNARTQSSSASSSAEWGRCETQHARHVCTQAVAQAHSPLCFVATAAVDDHSRVVCCECARGLKAHAIRRAGDQDGAPAAWMQRRCVAAGRQRARARVHVWRRQTCAACCCWAAAPPARSREVGDALLAPGERAVPVLGSPGDLAKQVHAGSSRCRVPLTRSCYCTRCCRSDARNSPWMRLRVCKGAMDRPAAIGRDGRAERLVLRGRGRRAAGGSASQHMSESPSERLGAAVNVSKARSNVRS